MSESYDIIDFGGRLFHTGKLTPESRTTFAPKFVSTRSQRDIQKLIMDTKRQDIRKLFTPEWIRNQEDRGACNGFAAAQAEERAEYKAGRSREKLSGEYLYSLMNGGFDRGSMLDDGLKLLLENGVAPYRDRHRRKFLEKDFTAEDHRDAVDHMALEIYSADTELELAEGLALGFVGVVAVHASNSFMRLDADGIAGSSNGPGNHAVGVDDVKIQKGRLVFDMFNSWDVNYGDEGRAYLTFDDHFQQTIRNHVFYLIRAVKTDKTDDIPEPQEVLAA